MDCEVADPHPRPAWRRKLVLTSARAQFVLSLVVCFLFGFCYNPMLDYINTTSNDLPLFIIGTFFPFFLINPPVTFFASFITAAVLVLFYVLSKRNITTVVCIASLLIHLTVLVVFSTAAIVQVKDKKRNDVNTKNILFFVLQILLSLLNGIGTSMNMCGFLLLSSSLSKYHLFTYLLGMQFGPVASSVIDFLGFLSQYYSLAFTEVDFYVMMGVFLIAIPLTLFLFVLNALINPFFRTKLFDASPSLVVDDQTVTTTRSHALIEQLWGTAVRIKTPLINLFLTYFTTSLVFPGFLLAIPLFLTANPFDSTPFANKYYIQYSYYNKAVNTTYFCFSFIGAIPIVLSSKFSRKTNLSASFLRFIFLVVFLFIFSFTSRYTIMNHMDIFIDNQSRPHLEEEDKSSMDFLVAFILICFWISFHFSTIVGFTNGLLFSQSIVSVVERAEQKVASSLVLFVISLATMAGGVLQCIGSITFHPNLETSSM